ncbi:MAG TPA: cation diffusion facilitator family transporter [Acidimicrobiia bacterium]|jgi:cation diffusion facilitator family transporter
MAHTESRRAVIAAFLANLAIAAVKFVTAAVTGSVAMLSEGFHSVADTGNQALLLWGMRQSAKPADPEHPFGRGKEIYFWSFMVAVMLFVGGAVLAIQHGIDALRHPHEVESLGISFVVLGIAIVIEFVSFRVALGAFNQVRTDRRLYRAMRDTKDSSLLVVLLEDSAALAGLFVALIGTTLVSLTHNAAWDGIASLGIGIILGLVAFGLATETKALLIGESASGKDQDAIRAVLTALPGVDSVGRILTMHLGPADILVHAEVDFAEGLTSSQVENTVKVARTSIQAAVPGARNVAIEPVHEDG